MSVLISSKRVFFGKDLASTILRTSITNISILIITTLTSIITARMLGVEGRGELSTILFWPIFLSGLIGFGLPTSLIFNMKQDSTNASDYFRLSISFLIPVSIIIGIIAWIFIPILLHKYSSTAIRIAQVYTLIAIPLQLALNMMSALAKSIDKFNIYNVIRLNVPFVNLLGLVLLSLLGSLNLVSSTFVMFLATSIILLYSIVALKKSISMSLFVSPLNIMIIKPLFNYGFKVFGMELLGTLYNQADKIIIVTLLTPSDFGLYSVVFALSRVFNAVQNAITEVIFPKVTGMDKNQVIKKVGRAFRISMMIMVIILLPSMFVGRFLLGILFGPEFIQASSTFYLLSTECIIGGGSWVLASSFNAIGRPGLIFIRQLIAILVTLGLFFVLAPIFGLLGIALALFSGSVVRLIITLIQLPQVFKVSVYSILFDKNDFSFIIRAFKKILGKGDLLHENHK